MKTREDWHKWFAWHPVVLRGRLVWMRTIERAWLKPSVFDNRFEGHWLYRPIAPKIGSFKVRTNPNGSVYIYAEGVLAFKRAIELLPLTRWEVAIPKKQCKVCDYKNAVRHGRADHRCPKCGRQLMLELLLMHEATERNKSRKLKVKSIKSDKRKKTHGPKN